MFPSTSFGFIMLMHFILRAKPLLLDFGCAFVSNKFHFGSIMELNFDEDLQYYYFRWDYLTILIQGCAQNLKKWSCILTTTWFIFILNIHHHYLNMMFFYKYSSILNIHHYLSINFHNYFLFLSLSLTLY